MSGDRSFLNLSMTEMDWMSSMPSPKENNMVCCTLYTNLQRATLESGCAWHCLALYGSVSLALWIIWGEPLCLCNPQLRNWSIRILPPTKTGCIQHLASLAQTSDVYWFTTSPCHLKFLSRSEFFFFRLSPGNYPNAGIKGLTTTGTNGATKDACWRATTCRSQIKTHKKPLCLLSSLLWCPMLCPPFRGSSPIHSFLVSLLHVLLVILFVWKLAEPLTSSWGSIHNMPQRNFAVRYLYPTTV